MSQQSITSEQKIPEVNEIRLSEMFRFIKRYTIIIGVAGMIFGILGYLMSYLLPVTYKSSSLILPESGTSSTGMGSLSSLARLSGLSKNETGGALQPELYPAILQAFPFSLYILKHPIVDEAGHQYHSFADFLNHENPDTISKDSNTRSPYVKNMSKQILSLSKSQEKQAKQVLSLITTVYDVKTGIITIEAEASDPVISAQLVEGASNYLIQYVTDYRAEKSVRETQFLGQRVIEAKQREQKAEFALQNYRDNNRNAFLNVARIEEQRLQSEYLLSQSLYSDIVRRWEESKIKVKEQQPVIKVLEPAKVPTNKSKPRRLIIALVFSFFGFLISFFYIFLLKEQMHKKLFRRT